MNNKELAGTQAAGLPHFLAQGNPTMPASMHRLEKMGEGRWRVVEVEAGPRITALVVSIMLLGYALVGFVDRFVI